MGDQKGFNVSIDNAARTSCAFVPVYCYYDRKQGGEIKTPILLMEDETLLLKAIILNIDPNILNADELKDHFLCAYDKLSSENEEHSHALDPYDVYPQLVTVLHTDNEDIYIYICELYEQSEPYFKKNNHSQIARIISYKEDIDQLIKGNWLDPLTEKILVALLEENYLTGKNDKGPTSIELF